MVIITHFQRAIIQYIKSSAGKQVRISIVAFSIRVGCEVRLKNAAIAVGIVFVAFKDCAIPLYQNYGAVQVIMDVVTKTRTIIHHEHYLVYVVAVDKEALYVVRIIVFAQNLPVVIVIIQPCVIGVNKVFLLNPSAECIVGEFRYIAAVFGDFDDAIFVVIFVFVAVFVCGEISGFDT